MKIASVKHAIPTEMITNDWVLERFRWHNRLRFTEQQLELLETQIRYWLEVAGTQVRYRVSRSERAIDFALQAGERALQSAGVAPADVDFVIYNGVARGWLEPATACVLQAELGLVNATSFDIVDACASWLRSLHIAQSYIDRGTYRCGLIVNCECGSITYRDWELAEPAELEYRFANWTIGEAATAAIVTDEASVDDFYFTFKTFAEHFQLSMFPLPNVAQFAKAPDERFPALRFSSLSRELFSATIARIVQTFEADPRLRQSYDIYFGHAASEKASRSVANKLGIPYERCFSTYPRYGNTVSASVPLGLSLALDEGRLKRGDRVLIVVGAAGITIGFATFTF